MFLTKLRFAKISWKLTLIYAGIFSLVLIILNAAILQGVSFFLQREAIGQVDDVTAIIVRKINHSGRNRKNLADPDLVQDIPSNDNIYVKIVDATGKIINESAKFDLKIPEKIPLISGKHDVLEKRLLFRSQGIDVRGKQFAYLQVVKDLSNEHNFWRVLFLLMVNADLVGIICAVLAGFLISKKMLKPISHLTETARIISIHGLNKRIEIRGPHDELTELAKTFNEMIERLQRSFEQQNQFVSDASHELRTPISVIQGYINLLDRWGKEDRAVLDESIQVIKGETANMTELIEKLLFLARGDSGVLQLKLEKFRLDDLMMELIKETRIIVSQVDIVLERNEPVEVYGDQRMIKQMMRALIDNGVKFTPGEGRITVVSVAEQDQAKISIMDNGIGIPAVEIPNIFNRFYQIDKARTGFKSSSGLGLAIVKSIVEAHHGSLTVKSREGEGTLVEVYLPLTVSHRMEMAISEVNRGVI